MNYSTEIAGDLIDLWNIKSTKHYTKIPTSMLSYEKKKLYDKKN